MRAPTHRGAWLAACALLAFAALALLLFGATRAVAPLIWRADAWTRAPWTLWSAALVHRSLGHGLANLLALGAVAVLGAALGAGRREALALLLAWPLATLGLLAWPAVRSYWGLSGVIHAACAVLMVRALARPDTRWMGNLLLWGLLIKLGLERAWAVPVAFEPAWGFNVVVAAHLTGALAGAGLVMAASAADGLRAP